MWSEYNLSAQGTIREITVSSPISSFSSTSICIYFYVDVIVVKKT